MSDSFDVIALPVVEVNLQSSIPVVEVTIDKTGPAGPPGVTNVDDHLADTTDPHGMTLTQTTLLATKATVGVVNGGTISTSQVLNFANGGCFKYTATGSLTLTVTSLAPGQRGSIHILAGATAPTISWVGVGAWLGSLPSYSAGKLTVISLFNDGTRIIGASSKSI